MVAKNVIVSEDVRQQFIKDGAHAHALFLHRQQVAEIEAAHGSVEAWRDGHSPRLSADRELKLARIIALMMEVAPGRPRGVIRHQKHRDMLLADTALAVYWASVVLGGEAAWDEERQRNRDYQRQSGDWKCRVSPAYVIRDLLPTYRAWGRMLIEGGVAPGMAGALMQTAAEVTGG